VGAGVAGTSAGVAAADAAVDVGAAVVSAGVEPGVTGAGVGTAGADAAGTGSDVLDTGAGVVADGGAAPAGVDSARTIAGVPAGAGAGAGVVGTGGAVAVDATGGEGANGAGGADVVAARVVDGTEGRLITHSVSDVIQEAKAALTSRLLSASTKGNHAHQTHVMLSMSDSQKVSDRARPFRLTAVLLAQPQAALLQAPSCERRPVAVQPVRWRAARLWHVNLLHCHPEHPGHCLSRLSKA
jgi:hypothetical protein